MFEQRLKEEEKDFQVTERRAFPVIKNRLGKIYEAEICLVCMRISMKPLWLSNLRNERMMF